MCCGQKRNDFTSKTQSTSSQSPSTSTSDVNFEYTGESALSITGSSTGRRYRFNRKGEVQSIDFRDASGMMAVPVLRRVP
ncbi:MAG: hypothetical protein C5B52_15445 [Bacteroidetes bacterium]|nr:MAG: hypothetical protein C5B52_15445 [Bacteroidota bacterium]